MAVARGALVAVALCFACALLAACGRDDSTSSGKPSKTKSAKAAPVKIAAPADGKRVRARETKSGAWIARV